MAKQEIPFEMVFRGIAKAYSKQEIIDKVDKCAGDVGDALFGSTSIPYTLQFNDETTPALFTGLRRQDAVLGIAKMLHEVNKSLCDEIMGVTQQAADMLDWESGIIFKHHGSAKASELLEQTVSVIRARTYLEFETLPDEVKEVYMRHAKQIIDQVENKKGILFIRD